MKNPLMTLLGAAAMAALLAACAAPAPEAPASRSPSGPVRSTEQAEAASAPRETSSEDPALQPPGGELPVKAIPGCRADLPYPLKMSGESLATDFTHWAAKDLDGNVVTEEVLAGRPSHARERVEHLLRLLRGGYGRAPAALHGI